MSSALVGYTGFVGSNILRGQTFDALYNSKNFEDIKNRNFDFLVFSGATATKWQSNANPDKDRQHIDGLIRNLETVSADRIVLISTIDVYKNQVGANEDGPTFYSENHPYGMNRGRLEDFVKSKFKKSHIIRLPGLFGQGIKKNIIFDFIHRNQIEKVDSRGSFQFYNLDYLLHDIKRIIDEDIPLINLSVEPVLVSEIYRACFGKAFVNEVVETPAKYDFRSKYSDLWRPNSQGYLYGADDCLKEIQSFVAKELRNKK